MRVGDLLEWLAAVALVAAGYLWQHSVPLALLIGAGALFYFAQGYARTPFPRPKLTLPSWAKRKPKQ